MAEDRHGPSLQRLLSEESAPKWPNIQRQNERRDVLTYQVSFIARMANCDPLAGRPHGHMAVGPVRQLADAGPAPGLLA
jgi:hypothetical protein